MLRNWQRYLRKLTFYAQGIKALDHINYEAAYESLSKAAVLQPNAVRLNLIVAALALKFGRSKKADEAKEYYETAIASYQNILQVRGLDPILRRNVQNRLKIAIEERDNLSQRDAQREGKGGLFIQKYNRELVEAKATPKPTPAAPAVPGAPGMPALPGAVPVQAPYGQPQPGVAQIPALPQAPAYPGAETPAPALQPGAATAVGIDVPPAEPGMPAPQPMPGQPGECPVFRRCRGLEGNLLLQLASPSHLELSELWLSLGDRPKGIAMVLLTTRSG